MVVEICRRGSSCWRPAALALKLVALCALFLAEEVTFITSSGTERKREREYGPCVKWEFETVQQNACICVMGGKAIGKTAAILLLREIQAAHKFLETLVFNGQFVSSLVSISGRGGERRAEAPRFCKNTQSRRSRCPCRKFQLSSGGVNTVCFHGVDGVQGGPARVTELDKSNEAADKHPAFVWDERHADRTGSKALLLWSDYSDATCRRCEI